MKYCLHSIIIKSGIYPVLCALWNNICYIHIWNLILFFFKLIKAPWHLFIKDYMKGRKIYIGRKTSSTIVVLLWQQVIFKLTKTHKKCVQSFQMLSLKLIDMKFNIKIQIWQEFHTSLWSKWSFLCVYCPENKMTEFKLSVHNKHDRFSSLLLQWSPIQ